MRSARVTSVPPFASAAATFSGSTCTTLESLLWAPARVPTANVDTSISQKRIAAPPRMCSIARMKYTRRRFLETAGAIVAAAGGGCSRRPAMENHLSGAPGVELSVEHDALPDYSHDLERYLVRVASAARERRKHRSEEHTSELQSH